MDDENAGAQRPGQNLECRPPRYAQRTRGKPPYRASDHTWKNGKMVKTPA